MLKRKFTLIDFIIIVVVIVSLITLKSKFSTAKIATSSDDVSENILVTFYIEETPDYTISPIKIGDMVKESIQNSSFGEVVEITPGESIYWKSDNSGNLISSSREGYNSLSITMKMNGVISGSGVSVDKSVYYVGQTISIYAGNSLLKDGRISEITSSNE